MSEKENQTQKPFLHEGHAKPKTRREFMAQGMMGSAAFLLAPTALSSLLSNKIAQASQCMAANETPENEDDGFLPFLVFDMAGGGGLPANFLVGNQEGPEDLIRTYSLHGWNPRQTTLDRRFGIPMAGDGVGKILEGMLGTMSTEAQERLRMGSFCHLSQDDTSSNRTSALIEVSRMGFRGQKLGNALGMTGRISGGNTGVPSGLNQYRPLEVRRIEDVLSSTGLAPIDQTLSDRAVRAILTGQIQLSQAQAERFSRLDRGEQLAELTECGATKNLGLFSEGGGLDPRQEEIFQNVYGLNPNSGPTELNTRVATMVSAVLKKASGPGALVVSGCDYHDGTQTSGDEKDLEMGRLMGRAVESAHRMGRPLVFQLLTDGGVYSDAGSRVWRGDAGDKSMTIVGFYRPEGAPEMRRIQVGHYTNGQGASTDSLFGANTSMAAYATLANYMHLCGKMSVFEELVPAEVFPREYIDDVLLFA